MANARILQVFQYDEPASEVEKPAFSEKSVCGAAKALKAK
jgi:hypothetical protein